MRILVVPYEDIDTVRSDRLAGDLSRFFGVEVIVEEPASEEPPGAYRPPRDQYASSVFLAQLRAKKDEAAGQGDSYDFMLGWTGRDLFMPRLSFIFGAADRDACVAIVSVHRLKPEFYGAGGNEELLADRLLKEAIHELGHLFELDHCDSRSCVMHFSQTIDETDIKGPGFCETCATRLEGALERLRG